MADKPAMAVLFKRPGEFHYSDRYSIFTVYYPIERKDVGRVRKSGQQVTCRMYTDENGGKKSGWFVKGTSYNPSSKIGERATSMQAPAVPSHPVSQEEYASQKQSNILKLGPKSGGDVGETSHTTAQEASKSTDSLADLDTMFTKLKLEVNVNSSERIDEAPEGHDDISVTKLSKSASACRLNPAAPSFRPAKAVTKPETPTTHTTLPEHERTERLHTSRYPTFVCITDDPEYQATFAAQNPTHYSAFRNSQADSQEPFEVLSETHTFKPDEKRSKSGWTISLSEKSSGPESLGELADLTLDVQTLEDMDSEKDDKSTVKEATQDTNSKQPEADKTKPEDKYVFINTPSPFRLQGEYGSQGPPKETTEAELADDWHPPVPPARAIRGEYGIMLRSTSHGKIVEEDAETGEFVLLDSSVDDDDMIAANQALARKYIAKGKKIPERPGPPIKTLSEAKNGATMMEDPRKRKPILLRIKNFFNERYQAAVRDVQTSPRRRGKDAFELTPDEAEVILRKDRESGDESSGSEGEAWPPKPVYRPKTKIQHVIPAKENPHTPESSAKGSVKGDAPLSPRSDASRPASLYEQMQEKIRKREREEQKLQAELVEMSTEDVRGSVAMLDEEQDRGDDAAQPFDSVSLPPLEAQEADLREYELKKAAMQRIRSRRRSS